jgi:hypothetical protein
MFYKIIMIGVLFLMNSLYTQACNFSLLKEKADFIDNKIWEKTDIPIQYIRENLDFLSEEDEFLFQKYTKYMKPDSFNNFYEVTNELISSEHFTNFAKICRTLHAEEDLRTRIATFMLFEEIAHLAVPHAQLLKKMKSYNKTIGKYEDIGLSLDSEIMQKFHKLSPKYH